MSKDTDNAKKELAQAISTRAKSGQVIGFGSGSTANAVIDAIGERVKNEGLEIAVAPTSIQAATKALHYGIRVLHPMECVKVDWAFDGADEVDPELRLIKGAGGALLKEKLVAERASHFVVLVTEEKLVPHLGVRFPVPVEIVSSSYPNVVSHLKEHFNVRSIELRTIGSVGAPLITEHGNFILDVRFATVGQDFEQQLKAITGVVETGLFHHQADEVIVAKGGGLVVREREREHGHIVESPFVA